MLNRKFAIVCQLAQGVRMVSEIRDHIRQQCGEYHALYYEERALHMGADMDDANNWFIATPTGDDGGIGQTDLDKCHGDTPEMIQAALRLMGNITPGLYMFRYDDPRYVGSYTLCYIPAPEFRLDIMGSMGVAPIEGDDVSVKAEG